MFLLVIGTRVACCVTTAMLLFTSDFSCVLTEADMSRSQTNVSANVCSTAGLEVTHCPTFPQFSYRLEDVANNKNNA